MRISTIDERRMYYSSDFDLRGLSKWIGQRARHMKFAMIVGRHTGVAAPAREGIKDDVVVIDDWDTAGDLRSYALDYLPEAIYYDRNRYVDVRECRGCPKVGRACSRCDNFTGQQLAFDLDPENVDCPYHGHIGEKIQSGRGLSFCMYEFKALRKQAMQRTHPSLSASEASAWHTLGEASMLPWTMRTRMRYRTGSESPSLRSSAVYSPSTSGSRPGAPV